VLVGGTAALAGSALDVTLGSLSSDDVAWGGYFSNSWAVAGNDSTSQDAFESLAQPNTAASASVTDAGADAMAATQEGSVAVAAFATTGPGSSAAYAYADQWVWFTTDEEGDLQFDLDFTITQSLSSQMDETAFADTSVGLSLYREGGIMDSMADDTLIDESTLYLWNFVDAGDSLSDQFSDTLSVWGSFAAQEVGYVWFGVDGQATAAVIPAPGAALLGMIGVGLIGSLRRRAL